MKKRIVTTLSLLALALIATPALAFKGQNPCDFQRETLRMAGYSPDSVYTLDSIQHLFQRIDVIPGSLATVLPGKNYRLNYSCSVINQLGRAEIAIVPVGQKPSCLVTHVRWPVTKP